MSIFPNVENSAFLERCHPQNSRRKGFHKDFRRFLISSIVCELPVGDEFVLIENLMMTVL